MTSATHHLNSRKHYTPESGAYQCTALSPRPAWAVPHSPTIVVVVVQRNQGWRRNGGPRQAAGSPGHGHRSSLGWPFLWHRKPDVVKGGGRSDVEVNGDDLLWDCRGKREVGRMRFKRCSFLFFFLNGVMHSFIYAYNCHCNMLRTPQIDNGIHAASVLRSHITL